MDWRGELSMGIEPTIFLDGRVSLHAGDCIDVLAAIPENSVDSVVCDPPYHLTSIVKRFGAENAAPAQVGKTGAYARASRGFMGQTWDGGDIAFQSELWAAVMRVLKPGGHLLAFSSTRTYHRMACAIEDAGFEIRDQIGFAYGSGFPKSHDVSKGIDKAAGAEREVVGRGTSGKNSLMGGLAGTSGEYGHDLTVAATDAARQWAGWGTALKPAWEPILLGSKPVTVTQHFAIVVSEITSILLEAAKWSNLSVSGAEKPLNVIRAKCDEAAFTVLANARIRSLESIGTAKSAALSSTFSAPASIDLIRTRDCSALLHVAPNGSLDETSERITQAGQAADMSTRLMVMSTSVLVDGMSESIVASWLNISEEILNATNKFTIETASKLTIVLRTLNCSLLPSISDDTGRLTPNWEPICLARKPLSEPTVAANVLRWGTGALNIDGCRVEAEKATGWGGKAAGGGSWNDETCGLAKDGEARPVEGRWPANVIHDGSEEVLAAFPDVGKSSGGKGAASQATALNGHVYGDYAGNKLGQNAGGLGDSGSAARFFYTAKASKNDRITRSIETVEIEWNSGQGLCRAALLVDTERSPGKDIVVSASEGSSAWNTFLSGSNLTDLFRSASKCTIETVKNSTTSYPTWNWLMRLLTSASIPVARCATENGSNHAGNAESRGPSLTIILGETVSLPGASRALSQTPLKISVSAKVHSHPTVKPVDLMQWLCRLVTPPGGMVLDCFAGTGTTGEAAFREGFLAILIEREAEYCADVARRMQLVLAGPDERQREIIKARGLANYDAGPLFAESWDEMWRKPIDQQKLVSLK